MPVTRLLSGLGRALPDWPRRRYHVLAGTNSWKEWRAAFRCLLSGDREGHLAIERFERAFAAAAGCTDALSFGAGRMALYVLLEAAGIGPGDEVVLPGFTCVVVPNALLYRGIRPVYADIEPRTFNADPASVAALITPRTRAVYLQHTFGTTAPVEALKDLCRRHGLFLIEDAAHSLGALHAGRRHGSLGDAAYFSTDHSKVVSTHLGGALTTSDAGLARRLREIQRRTPFPSRSFQKRILASFLAEHVLLSPGLLWAGRPLFAALWRTGLLARWRDEHLTELPASSPYPCRLPAAQALLGLSQLGGLAENLSHRREIAGHYESAIGWNRGCLPGAFADQAWLRYSFLVRDRAAFERRLGRRFVLGTWFPTVLYGRDSGFEAVGYRPGSCPTAEFVARHIVNLPTHSRIPLDFAGRIAERHGRWIQGELVAGR